MIVRDLSLHKFRNYDELELAGLEKLVIFIGPNASGKTNVLEAISLLTAAESFRHPQISQLVRKGEQSARIRLTMADDRREVTCALMLEPGKKRYTLNGKAKTAIDVRGILPAVTFVPDDLELAKKSSSVKRAALDSLGAQLSKNYDIVRRDYEKALRYKNRLLKEEAPRPLVEAMNETLVAVATQLYSYRRALFERITPIVGDIYGNLSQSGEQFHAAYLPSWLRVRERFSGSTDGPEVGELSREEVKDQLNKAVSEFADEELRTRRALVGPHNDQITFFLSGADASAFASQGQQRSIVLAWKLAEVAMVKRVLSVNPVLLLDDVMSELDETRRSLLVESVGNEVQTFITATDLSPFDDLLLERAQIIRLGME